MMEHILRFAPEVEAALAVGRPVVALESTLITHGLPRPTNLQVARQLEVDVRAGGAIPATIAILRGKPTIGLTDGQLEELATADHVRKCSRRDLPIVMAQGEYGATTVAGTMILAHLAGIVVFATGGIGGVHRGHPFDVSADLLELGRTPVAVVCAGIKSILDLPLTLEKLETQGVPVVGYGTATLPAFYTRDSGLPIDARMDSIAEVAALVRAREALQLSQGTLIVCPIPAEAEWPAQEAETAIAQATAEAESRGISGRDVTPFILGYLAEISNGRSLEANIALLRNNVRLAAQLAKALSSSL